VAAVLRRAAGRADSSGSDQRERPYGGWRYASGARLPARDRALGQPPGDEPAGHDVAAGRGSIAARRTPGTPSVRGRPDVSNAGERSSEAILGLTTGGGDANSRLLHRLVEEPVAPFADRIHAAIDIGLRQRRQSVPVRTLGRRQEIATRTALGATPSQLTAQFVMEALLAGTIAAFAGGELAVVLIRLLTNAAPPDIPRIEHAALNFNVFAVSIGAAMLATFACVMGPIRLLRVRRGDGAIGSGMRLAGSVGGSRLQRLFILAQAALTVLARIPFRRCHGAIR